VNSDCPQHYALNASGKEAINLGSISASGIAGVPSSDADDRSGGKKDIALSCCPFLPALLRRQRPGVLHVWRRGAAHVSLVAALHPLFLLAYGILFTIFCPAFGREHLARRHVL